MTTIVTTSPPTWIADDRPDTEGWYRVYRRVWRTQADLVFYKVNDKKAADGLMASLNDAERAIPDTSSSEPPS